MSKDDVGAEQRNYDKRWTHNGNKFVIGTLHGAPIEIVAQYNPKEVARQAAATWTPHPNTSAKYATNGESNMWSEYGTTAPRTLTVELLFDGYEEGISIAPVVEALESLTIPVDMKSRDMTKRRPQLCVAVWGKQQLRCVVTSVATKLTMFDTSGQPMRASCTVVLTEVDVVAMMKTDVRGAIDRVASKSGNVAATTPSHELPYPPEDSKPTRVPAPNRSQPAPAPATAATPKPAPAAAKPPAPASAPIQSPPAASGKRDETPEEVAADEKRAGAENDADAAKYQKGTATQPFDPATMGDEDDEAPENVAADETRAGEANDADAAKYQRGTPSKPFDGSDLDSPPQQPPAQTGTPSAQVDPNAMDGKGDHVFTNEPPAADATSGADSATADPKYKAAAEDME